MSRWQQYAKDNTSGVEYFSIQYKEKGDIDSMATLIGIDGKTLIRIAIDLDIHTPDFIPCVPTFRNEMKEEYSTTYDVFNKACKQVYEDASMAISLANSTLESLIKQILQDERVDVKWDEKYTLKKLVEAICKAFIAKDNDAPLEIKSLCSSLTGACDAIESIRNRKTIAHGKTDNDYIVSDPLYAVFIVNSVATIGQFLYSYYKTKYPTDKSQIEKYDTFEISPFGMSQNPFDSEYKIKGEFDLSPW